MASLAAFLKESGAPAGARVSDMVAAAEHRGTRCRTIALGNCVLATGSHDDSADVALGYGLGHAAIIAGRVDNLAHLARELGLQGQAEGQADLIIAAFRALGPELPKRLRGAYAVVLTDGKSLFCFRDHIGFGKLFYRQQGDELFVATEAKQVLAGAGLAATPDLDAVEHMFYEDADDESTCALRGVNRLPASVMLTMQGKRLALERYWHPDRLLETLRLSRADIRGRFDALMTQAVERVLTGDDVVTLSGGIDSPAVAAFAAPVHRRMTGRPIHALSAEFPDYPSVDERRYVELIGERLEIPVEFYRPAARPLSGLERWVGLADGPFPTTSLAEAYEQYTLARSLGTPNILTGEFAEFLIDLRANLVPHLVGRGRIAAAARHLAAQRAAGSAIGALLRQVAAGALPSRVAAKLARRPGRPPQLPDWVDPPSWSRLFRRAAAPRDRWRQTQLSVFVGAGLSLEADESVQALCRVRVRRPWADIDLWEFFLGLPAETKFPDTRSKTLVRRLLAGRVPDEILRRRSKTVFDEAVRAKIDYDVLRRWLSSPTHHIVGVDYTKLGEHLDREDLNLADFIWARDLAVVHVFLGRWELGASSVNTAL